MSGRKDIATERESSTIITRISLTKDYLILTIGIRAIGQKELEHMDVGRCTLITGN